MSLQIGIGFSQSSTSQTAAQEAVTQALNKLGSSRPAFMLVFADYRYDQTALMKQLSQSTNIPFVGCSSSGVYLGKDFNTTHGVVIIIFSTNQISFTPLIAQNIHQKPLKGAEQSAKQMLKICPNPEQKKSLLIFAHSTPSSNNLLLQGLQNVLGENFEICGAVGSNDEQITNTFQYYNGQIYQNALVGVLISGEDIITSSAIGTAWESVGNRNLVTKSNQNIVYELDEKPALDIYKLYLGNERSSQLPQIAYTYPFAILPPPGSPQINDPSYYLFMRTPYVIDEDNKSLIFNGEIPNQAYLTLTSASRQNLIQQSQKTARLAKESLHGAQPLLILNFISYGRTKVLGRRLREEIETIQKTISPDAPIAGFFSSGEFGPYDEEHPEYKNPKFQNQCNAIWILSTNLFKT